MKKLNSLFILLIISLSAICQTVFWDGSTATSFGTQEANAGESESNPILISTPSQLRYLASLVANATLATADAWKGKCYKMTADFDLDNRSFSAGRIGLAAGNTGTYNTSTSSRPFTGTFDGNGHTISNMNMVINGSFVALFPYLSGATVKNLNLLSGIVSGINQVGGLFSIADNSTISNCYSGCNVNASGIIAGGVAACAFGTTSITDSYNSGRVNSNSTSTNMVGGLIGQSGKTDGSSAVTITNCYNRGNVVGFNGNIGGLIGYAENLTMTKSYNVADSVVMNPTVTTNSYMGGLIGRMRRNGAVDKCFNVGLVYSSGTITMNNFIGGLFGSAEYLSAGATVNVSDCYNAGSLITTTGTQKFMAGIAPVVNTVTFNRCINYGAIYSGGVTTPSSIGGISTNITSSTFNDCYYDSNFITTPTNPTGTASTTAVLINGNLLTNFDNTVWTATENLYPSLSSLNSTLASIVSVAPIAFVNSEKFSEVTSAFTVANQNLVEWTSSNPSYVTISGNTATPHLQSTAQNILLTASLGDYKKVVPITLAIDVSTEISKNTIDETIKVISSIGKSVHVFISNTEGSRSKFRFHSLQGQVIDEFEAVGNQFTFDLNKYPAGYMILSVTNGNFTVNKKIMSY